MGGGDFDLPRMLRMLTTFRSMVADACYGGMSRQSANAPAGGSAAASTDEPPAMMDPVEAVAARKARLAVTHEVRLPRCAPPPPPRSFTRTHRREARESARCRHAWRCERREAG